MRLKKYRAWETGWIYVKILLAYILAKLFYRNDHDTILLIGGNLGEKYEDNAAVFHEYAVNNFSDQMDIYWMYDPRFDYIKKHQIPKAVPLGSFQNYLLFFRASYTVHGHSIIYDLAPYIDKFISLNKKTVMLHISHGIECFKKILIQKEDVPLLERCNYFNCASEYEYSIKRYEWGIPDDKLVVTGMARFDRLLPDHPPTEIKRLLLMFTWREWLFDLTEEEFLRSTYFQSTAKLLKSDRLQRIVQEQELEVRVILHPFMKRYEKHFRKNGIISGKISFFSFDEILIMQELQDADMLITDYSSICWDFIYMNKPIIFYTFDQEEFLANRGSYLNLDTDLFGYKARNQDEALDYLDTLIREKRFENPFFNKATEYIDFFDQRNCERLANALFGENIVWKQMNHQKESEHENHFPLVSAEAVQYNCNKQK
ncbi:CDP-glycerol--glycerophosphate glycerophosphotransferase [Sporosarcina sp. P37]|uniref:CDP-glycerol glycerophosphotransferase family protein n=1 Tax=unclassified Sporosarcina TaxID=2647733 RepID=UPI000A17F3D9|nr:MULTISPECIES: CDP-glycerol glycerophosphotransferase family protein [unclassified Sporosarcina]ARK24283.1 CDP-glycerol--glycerophosphate glycerophosphotransferase [Sporosarcina sp. P37]PID18440.1 CDP-glycerol--glycerophosphate glycerophosphotransferase [Sporosarcina sp. P35]